MKPRLLNTVGEAFSQDGKDILARLFDVDYCVPTQQQLDHMVCQYDAALIGLGLTFHKETLKKASKLKFLATATTGHDHIDEKVASEQGIILLSLRGERDFLNTITGTAELAFGLLLSLIRNIPEAATDVKAGHWNREQFIGHQLHGKTLGIIGFGRLGTIVARYGNAFFMNVIAYDPAVPNDEMLEQGVTPVSLNDLYGQSDVVSVHAPLSEETVGMIGENAFKKMKSTAILVNTARGKIVDETVLMAALDEKHIAGYATDVLDGELSFISDNAVHPLIAYAKEHSNVLIVPHIGGMVYESREATDIFIAKKLVENWK